jgi:hypothetical protein
MSDAGSPSTGYAQSIGYCVTTSEGADLTSVSGASHTGQQPTPCPQTPVNETTQNAYLGALRFLREWYEPGPAEKPMMCVSCHSDANWAGSGGDLYCDPCVLLASISDIPRTLDRQTNIFDDLNDRNPENLSPINLRAVPQEERREYGNNVSECRSVPLTEDNLDTAPDFHPVVVRAGQNAELAIPSGGDSNSTLLFDVRQTSSSSSIRNQLTTSSTRRKRRNEACETCRREKIRCRKEGPNDVCYPRPKREYRYKNVGGEHAKPYRQKCQPCSRGGFPCDYSTPCSVCEAYNRVDQCKLPIRGPPHRGSTNKKHEPELRLE